MTESYKEYNITNRVTSSSTATPDLWNDAYDQITYALNDLSARVYGTANKSAVLQHQAVVAGTVSVGDVVYYNAGSGYFDKALAAVRQTPGMQGQFIQADTSRVQGIVVQKPSQTTATILRTGYWDCGNESDCILHFAVGTSTGVGGSAGIYYVDPITPGCITSDPGYSFRQPCISYYGNGKFSVVTNYLAHDNHRHASLVIPASSWAGGSSYDISGSDLAAFGEVSSQTTVAFLGGTLSNQFSFNDHTITYNGGTINETVTLFNHYPFSYGDAVVRSISVQPDNKLQIDSAVGGQYKLSVRQYSDSQVGSPVGKAITDLSGTKKIYTPVTTTITAGAGISCMRDTTTGQTIISTNDYDNNILTPDDVINYGTQMAAAGLLSYLVFPAQIKSTAVLQIKYKWPISSASFNVKAWVTSKGPGTGSLSVQFYWLQWQRAGTSGASVLSDSSQPIATTTLTLNNSDPSKLIAYQSAQQTLTNITGPGKLIIKLTADTPSSALNLSDYGCILTRI